MKGIGLSLAGDPLPDTDYRLEAGERICMNFFNTVRFKVNNGFTSYVQTETWLHLSGNFGFFGRA